MPIGGQLIRTMERDPVGTRGKRGAVRRSVIALVVVATTLGSTAATAAASPVTVHVDPNDSSSNLDIHKVATHLSATTLYLRITSWDRFRVRDMNDAWEIALDIAGTSHVDRWVGIFPTRHGVKCDVRRGPHGFEPVGTRHATRPDRKSIACRLPRGWFGPFVRTVRLRALIEATQHALRDDAPNGGRYYRWSP